MSAHSGKSQALLDKSRRQIEATGMSGDLDHRNIRQGRQDRVNREKRSGRGEIRRGCPAMA